MYVNDVKLFAKNEKDLESLIRTIKIYNQDIAMEFASAKCARLIIKSGKRQIKKGVKILNQEKNQKARWKGNLQVFGNIGSGHHQTSGNERKNFLKEISGEQESFSKNKFCSRNLIVGINTWDASFW